MVCMSGEIMSTKQRHNAKGKILYTYTKGIRANYPLSLDYLFQLAVEMKKLGIPWISEVARVGPDRP